MDSYLLPVVMGIIFGFVGRTLLLRTDFRQYPTYPTGRIIHLSLGFIAGKTVECNRRRHGSGHSF